MLPLIVVDGGGPPRLGRNCPEELKMNWHSITQPLAKVLKRHDQVFNKGLGTIKVFKADMKLQVKLTLYMISETKVITLSQHAST